MPKRKTADAMRAAFDPDDSPTKPSKQSVSEQQTPANMLPMHGLNMWQSILTYVALFWKVLYCSNQSVA